MTIARDTGNVGIGTTAPQAKLHVSDGYAAFTFPGNPDEQTILSTLDACGPHTFMVGGPDSDALALYWKDYRGQVYMTWVNGSIVR
jgi:hypothetical protein